VSKPLQFITLREPATGRACSLSFAGRLDNGTLCIVGGLAHNGEIVPDSIADADKLIAWLQEWKHNEEQKELLRDQIASDLGDSLREVAQ